MYNMLYVVIEIILAWFVNDKQFFCLNIKEYSTNNARGIMSSEILGYEIQPRPSSLKVFAIENSQKCHRNRHLKI